VRHGHTSVNMCISRRQVPTMARPNLNCGSGEVGCFLLATMELPRLGMLRIVNDVQMGEFKSP
jgi:hypothetical protein